MDHRFGVTFTGKSDEVGRVTSAFADFADAHALPAAVRRTMLVALDELVMNAVTHGATLGGPGVRVTVKGALEPGRLVVAVCDNGRPFDPFALATPDTTLSVEERTLGGLGIYLVRQMMDEVRYSRRGDQNEVVLIKHLETLDGARSPKERT
ncbi:MAG: ATP-binding protein [Gemmatimonadaceae bacterium]|nr:ATP-binding protein [Gemmatimonadaceae bacterium]